jgi:beta propeller repeat protein
MVVRDLSPGDKTSCTLEGDVRSGRRISSLVRSPPLFALILLGLLVFPAAAGFSVAPVSGVFKVGDVVTLSGINTDNSTTFFFLTGPHLDDNGVMLTNTSGKAFDGNVDSVPVSANYSWTFEWNTSLPEVNLNDGIYFVYASSSPVSRKTLGGHSYAEIRIDFQGRLFPAPVATTVISTPVPTWAPPPAGTEVEVSSRPSNDYPGRFDGDLLVYESRRGEGDSDIYLYNITSGNTTAVATGPAIQTSPSVSGGKVVYSAYTQTTFNKSDADLYIYDVASGATERLTLTGDQLNPRIYGNLLAWQDEPPGHSSVNVILYDLGTKARLKVPARTWAYSPDLSGGRVIWLDDPAGPAVYLYEIAGKTVRRVTNKTGIKGTPEIDGNRITWADSRNDYDEIYVLDLGSMIETRLTTDNMNHFTPAISGERVVWVDFRNGNRDIYLYDLAARREIAVTTNEKEQVAPQIAGCTIAWADNRNGSYNVYYKTLPGCTPSPAPAPVSLQPEITYTPTPVTTRIPTTTVSTPPPVIPVSTTSPPPPSAAPTTKSPGFGAFPALAALMPAVLILWRKRFL